MNKLIIKNMRFTFNKETNYFFNDINITFESGNTYFIQGKNGVGKSTFFSILQGTIPADALLTGTIVYNNQELIIKHNSINAQLSSHVKTVVQDVNSMIVNTMTVEENLKLANLPRYPHIKPLSGVITTQNMLTEAQIANSMIVQQLSGGQKQILAIIMALQKQTDILLLDEPTAALDEKNTHLVIQFLIHLAKHMNIIVLIITHDKELLEKYPDAQQIIIQKNEADVRSVQLL